MSGRYRYNRLSLKRHDSGLKKQDRWFRKGYSPGKRKKIVDGRPASADVGASPMATGTGLGGSGPSS